MTACGAELPIRQRPADGPSCPICVIRRPLRAADALREREFARLADAVPPTLETLRSLTPGAFRT